MSYQKRRVLGLASDDTYLQSLIPFVSTEESRRLGQFAAVGSKRPMAKALDLPISLVELEVDRLQQSGNDAFRQRDYPKAIRLWSEALERAAELNAPTPKKNQASRSAQLLANRCQAYISSGDDFKALADAVSAVAAAPGWPKAYYRHGTCLMRLNQFAEAHKVLQVGLEMEPSNSDLIKACEKAAEEAAKEQPVTNGVTEVSDAGGGAGASTAEEPPSQPQPMPVEVSDEYKRVFPPPSSSTTTTTAELPRADISTASPANLSSLSIASPTSPASPPAIMPGGSPATPDTLPVDKPTRANGVSSSSAQPAPPPPPAATTPSLPLPEWDLQEDGTFDGKEGFALLVCLPLCAKSSMVNLEMSSDLIELEAPGYYGPLKIPLPRRVDDDKAAARFDTKTRTLKISLPAA